MCVRGNVYVLGVMYMCYGSCMCYGHECAMGHVYVLGVMYMC
jgi:hypothetical protein